VVNFIMAGYKDNLLGEANSFLEVLEQVSRLAPLNKPVLIIGERGTGKKSPTVFYLSGRWDGPFISLNCAALNENLLIPAFAVLLPGHRNATGRFERAWRHLVPG
jgi:psp operon transcriptional activator